MSPTRRLLITAPAALALAAAAANPAFAQAS